jgi:hypothetical protein
MLLWWGAGFRGDGEAVVNAYAFLKIKDFSAKP